MAQLSIDDADPLHELADRCRRAAQTASATAEDETDAKARAMLGVLSATAVSVAAVADQLATWAEENR